MAVIGPSFLVSGIEPASVRRAAAKDRRAYWTQVSRFVQAAKDVELREGLDRYGDPLHPIAKYTREHRHSEMGAADPLAPPLTPAYGKSRTRSLFNAAPTPAFNGVVCWWLFDPITGESWGEMLRIHAEGRRGLPGSGRGGLPIRDVIGLSPKSLAEVKRKADAWWADYEPGDLEPRQTTGPIWGVSKPLPEGPFAERERARTRTATPGFHGVEPGHTYTMQVKLGLKPPRAIQPRHEFARVKMGRAARKEPGVQPLKRVLPRSGAAIPPKVVRPTLNDLTVAQVDAIALGAELLKSLPVIIGENGEQITISIHTNPFYGVLHSSENQKPFLVRTYVDGEMNDSHPASTMEQAEKFAWAWHRTLTREETKK